MLLLFSLLACCGPPKPPSEPVDLPSYVDPFIATGGIGYGVGCGYPGAAVPFGMVKASPDTADKFGMAQRVYRGGGYYYEDVYVQGFSSMHMYAVGSTDYGIVALMPSDGVSSDRTTEAGYRAPFRHDDEDARPGWYTVTLDDPAVAVELSATEHTALHRYRFAETVAEPTVLVDLCHTLGEGVCLGGEVDVSAEGGTVRGWMWNAGEMAAPFKLWFEVRFERPPVSWGTWTDEAFEPGSTWNASLDDGSYAGVELGAWLTFDAPDVGARVAISMVDAEGAALNLAEEHDGFDVEAAAAAAGERWADALSAVRVWGGTEDERTIFATALYHSLQMPTITSDADGRYRGFDQEVHVASDFRYRTDFSLWDTYRTTHPLYTLLWPDEHVEMLRSLARMAEEGGALPRWPAANWDGGFMVGSPADIVVSEAWLKGLREYDEDVIFDTAVAVAAGAVEAPYAGRPDLSTYETYGYYPSDLFGSSVAATMEYAIADAALARVGAVAPDLVPAGDAALFAERAGYWRNLWDPGVGFFHGRRSDGTFDELSSEAAWLDEFSEGNARQYLWLVPQDTAGLFEALGGEARAIERLDEFFAESVAYEEDGLTGLPKPWYWHGNEVDIHAPWLFALAGRPDLTVEWVDWVMGTWYGTGPDGLAGNDDGGTLSAWYVWAAMGLYPMAGSDRYVLGRPRFDRVEVPGQELVIERVEGEDLEGVYLDGALVEEADVRHRHLVGGHTLSFAGR